MQFNNFPLLWVHQSSVQHLFSDNSIFPLIPAELRRLLFSARFFSTNLFVLFSNLPCSYLLLYYREGSRVAYFYGTFVRLINCWRILWIEYYNRISHNSHYGNTLFDEMHIWNANVIKYRIGFVDCMRRLFCMYVLFVYVFHSGEELVRISLVGIESVLP